MRENKPLYHYHSKNYRVELQFSAGFLSPYCSLKGSPPQYPVMGLKIGLIDWYLNIGTLPVLRDVICYYRGEGTYLTDKTKILFIHKLS